MSDCSEKLFLVAQAFQPERNRSGRDARYGLFLIPPVGEVHEMPSQAKRQIFRSSCGRGGGPMTAKTSRGIRLSARARKG